MTQRRSEGGAKRNGTFGLYGLTITVPQSTHTSTRVFPGWL